MPAKIYHSRGTSDRKEYACDAGRSIQEIVLELNPETGEWEAPTVCLANGAPLLRKDWADHLVAENEVVIFRSLPMGGGGGGSNPLKMILSIVVMVAAVWAGGLAAGLLGLVSGSAAAGIVSGLVTAGVMALAGGIMKTKALPGGRQASLTDESSPTYSIGQANNAARMYGVIGEVFGRMQIVPDRVTNSYILYESNEQYLHQIFGTGKGRVDVEAMYFGDSLFWDKKTGVQPGFEAEIQFRDPYQIVTLFPDNVEISPDVAG